MRNFLVLLLGTVLLSAEAVDTFTLGMIEYANGNHARAIEAFRKVVKEQPQNARAYLWLARALGRKAENSNPFRAMFMVGDIRSSFERAARLAPNDEDIQADLFEFYLDAPSAVGGGMDRAQAQAKVLEKLNPAEGHWAAAKIAEKKKRYDVAESELKEALALAPHVPGRSRELGLFYRRRGRWTEMEEYLRKAGDAKARYYLASAWLQQGVKLEEAEKLARQFLADPAPPPGDEPTRAQGRLLLGQIQARLGHRDEALDELRAALAENPDLKAAKTELERLRQD